MLARSWAARHLERGLRGREYARFIAKSSEAGSIGSGQNRGWGDWKCGDGRRLAIRAMAMPFKVREAETAYAPMTPSDAREGDPYALRWARRSRVQRQEFNSTLSLFCLACRQLGATERWTTGVRTLCIEEMTV